MVCRYHGRQGDYSIGFLHSSVTNRFFFCLCCKAIAITLALSDTAEITIIQPSPPYNKQTAETSLLEKEALRFSHGGSGSFDREATVYWGAGIAELLRLMGLCHFSGRFQNLHVGRDRKKELRR